MHSSKFGDYTLGTQQYVLRRLGQPLNVSLKIFDLLVHLVQHRDRVVPRQELFDLLWPEQFISDTALQWLIAAARRAVEDSGRRQQSIKTIRSSGHRVVLPVETVPHLESAPEQAFAARRGLHTGEVIVGPIGADPRQTVLSLGDTTKTATQLLRLAEPDTLVLSAAAATRLGAFAHLVSLDQRTATGTHSGPDALQGAWSGGAATIGRLAGAACEARVCGA